MTPLPPALRHHLAHRLSAAPPATPEDIAASEERLGFRLPGPVRELYEIANGGAGFLGLVNGQVDDLGSTAVDLYESFLQPEDDPEAPVPWQWRLGVLPILDWGCNTYSCVDCSDETAPMIGRDGFLWIPDGTPFTSWLTTWSTNTLPQPTATTR